MRLIPPFLGLVAFDAVLRRGTFAAAAADLGLTQSAVSHRIARLERHFGTRLLDRSPSGPSLTAAGAAIAPELGTALESLEGLAVHVRHRRSAPTLRVGAGSALCDWWLMPRLVDFARRHPGVAVQLFPIETGAPEAPPVDVRILWLPAEEARRTTTQAPLVPERVLPVCAPALLPEGRSFASPADLLRLPLIHKGVEPVGEWSWSVWLRRLGLGGRPLRGGELQAAEMGLCLRAAVAGAGVALGRSILIHDALMDGRLTPALAADVAMPSSKLHVARWPARLSGDPNVRAFVAWIAQASAGVSPRQNEAVAG